MSSFSGVTRTFRTHFRIFVGQVVRQPTGENQVIGRVPARAGLKVHSHVCRFLRLSIVGEHGPYTPTHWQWTGVEGRQAAFGCLKKLKNRTPVTVIRDQQRFSFTHRRTSRQQHRDKKYIKKRYYFKQNDKKQTSQNRKGKYGLPTLRSSEDAVATEKTYSSIKTRTKCLSSSRPGTWSCPGNRRPTGFDMDTEWLSRVERRDPCRCSPACMARKAIWGGRTNVCPLWTPTWRRKRRDGGGERVSWIKRQERCRKEKRKRRPTLPGAETDRKEKCRWRKRHKEGETRKRCWIKRLRVRH